MPSHGANLHETPALLVEGLRQGEEQKAVPWGFRLFQKLKSGVRALRRRQQQLGLGALVAQPEAVPAYAGGGCYEE